MCVTLDMGGLESVGGTEVCCTGWYTEMLYHAGDQGWRTAVSCGTLLVDDEGSSIDLYYFFNRDEDGALWFNFRSDVLGYQEGYERRWLVGYDVQCSTLETELTVTTPGGTATLSASLFYKIIPTCCTLCNCLPPCISFGLSVCSADPLAPLSFDMPGETVGVLCWDNDIHGYCGRIYERDGTDHYVAVYIRPDVIVRVGLFAQVEHLGQIRASTGAAVSAFAGGMVAQFCSPHCPACN